MKWLEDFVNQWNPIIVIISFILAIISVPLAIIFYKRGKLKKELSYTFDSVPVILKGSYGVQKTFLEKIQITYDNKRIETLTASRYAIWNSGDVTIEKDNVVQANPILFSPKDNCAVYEIGITTQNEPSNNFKLLSDGNGYRLEFDYIDKDQGCVINILHSGIRLQGKIKGAGEITQVKDVRPYIDPNKNLFGRLNTKYQGIFMLTLLSFGLLTISLNASNGERFLIFCFFILITIAYRNTSSHQKTLPKSLHKDFEYFR
jgi:hypothetical protein